MNIPRYARLVARLLSGAPNEFQPSAEARRRSLLTIERGLAARRRRFLLQWVAAAGLLVLSGAGVWRLSRGDTDSIVVMAITEGVDTRVRGADQRLAQLVDGEELSNESGLVTRSEGAILALSTGTRLRLGTQSEVRVLERGPAQRFALIRGALHASVAKLGTEQSFIIQSADAEIEVRGTAFELALVAPDADCSFNTATRLRVTEGVVIVRADGLSVEVPAGEHWPVECPPTHSSLLTPTKAQTIAALKVPAHVAISEASGVLPEREREQVSPARPSSKTLVSANPVRHTPAAPEVMKRGSSSSSLEAQTELFSNATNAQRDGRIQQALASYAALVQRYPQSALAEGALVARMRLLRSINLPAARSEARGYLKRYGDGYAAAEARALLGVE